MTEQTQTQLTELEKIRTFLLAGRAVFTLLSVETGNRFTFRVERTPARARVESKTYFVSLLTGPEQYSYLGLFSQDGSGRLSFRRTKKSIASETALSNQAFSWLLQRVYSGRELPERVRFYHEGQCARCGRPLTTPESVRIGIGPECLKRLGN